MYCNCVEWLSRLKECQSTCSEVTGNVFNISPLDKLINTPSPEVLTHNWSIAYAADILNITFNDYIPDSK